MIYLNKLLVVILILSTPLFSQTRIDTTHINKEIKDGRKQIDFNATNTILNRTLLLNDSFSIPLNMKIYQKVMMNDFLIQHKFSREELSTVMSHDELASFERHRLITRKILSDIYGEDLIDVDKILAALGITQEQLTIVVAILKFFLM